ncbi:MAG: hypothetical protein NUV51_02575 [Sulfuricaulis sp.]|nr:hypothetical protein [Sulfuricaulis sp.]
MNKLHSQRGAGPLGIIVVIVVLVIIGLIIIAVTNQSTPPPPSQAPGTTSTCFTYSLGFLEFQCGDNKFMGASFGIWDCKAEIGAHQCR